MVGASSSCVPARDRRAADGAVRRAGPVRDPIRVLVGADGLIGALVRRSDSARRVFRAGVAGGAWGGLTPSAGHARDAARTNSWPGALQTRAAGGGHRAHDAVGGHGVLPSCSWTAAGRLVPGRPYPPGGRSNNRAAHMVARLSARPVGTAPPRRAALSLPAAPFAVRRPFRRPPRRTPLTRGARRRGCPRIRAPSAPG